MRREDGVFIGTLFEDRGRILGEIDSSSPVPSKEKGQENRGTKGSDELQPHLRPGSAGFLDISIEANQWKRITALSNSSGGSKGSNERRKDGGGAGVLRACRS